MLRRSSGTRATWLTEPWISLALFGVALLARVAAGFVLRVGNNLSIDEREHFNVAVNLLRGLGYAHVPQQAVDLAPVPTAYRMPGPALAMALSMAIFGAKASVARGLSIVVSSTAAPLLYRFARTATSGRIAFVAGLAGALYPTWIYCSLSVLSEPYFVPALLAALTLSVQAVERHTWQSALAAGIAWGMTTLFKPHGLPMTALVCIYLAWSMRSRSPSRRIMRLGALTIGFALVMTPWVARNLITLHRFIPLATEGGETFLGSNNPYTANDPKHFGMWVPPLGVPEYARRLSAVHDEFDRSRVQSQMAIDYLRNNLSVIPELVFRKEVRFLTPIPGSQGLVRLGIMGSYGLLLVLLLTAVVGRLLNRSPALDLALLWLATSLLVTAAYWGNLTRGRAPLEVVFLPWGVMAGAALATAAARARGPAVAAMRNDEMTSSDLSNASDRPPIARSIAVFAYNERDSIVSCLDSIDVSMAPESTRVYVLMNGCTDGTEEAVQSYAQQHAHVVPIAIKLGDKANAWNHYVQDIAPEARIHYFMDGDVMIAKGSLTHVQECLDANPIANGVAGLPLSGRSMASLRARLINEHLMMGTFYALRGSLVREIRARGIRLPIGMFGEDGLISTLVKWDLDPSGSGNPNRIVACLEGGFYFNSLSPVRPSHWRIYRNRKMRFAVRRQQARMLYPVLWAAGISAMPKRVSQMYRQRGDMLKLEWNGVDTLFDYVAIRRIKKRISQDDAAGEVDEARHYS